MQEDFLPGMVMLVVYFRAHIASSITCSCLDHYDSTILQGRSLAKGQFNSTELENMIRLFGHWAVSLCFPGLCSKVLLEDRTRHTLRWCYRNLLPLCRRSQNVCGVRPLPNRWVTAMIAILFLNWHRGSYHLQQMNVTLQSIESWKSIVPSRYYRLPIYMRASASAQENMDTTMNWCFYGKSLNLTSTYWGPLD